jgi:hypothetical protein
METIRLTSLDVVNAKFFGVAAQWAHRGGPLIKSCSGVAVGGQIQCLGEN